MAKQIKDERLAWCLKALGDRQRDYRAYREYYDGVQTVNLATEQFTGAFGELVSRLNYNRCMSVVDAHADKLQITGFDVEEGPDTAVEAVMRIWRRNRMDRRSGEVHTEALTLGDAYVIVWPHPTTGEAVIYPQFGDRVIVRYSEDDPNRVDYALKTWRLRDGRWRVNLYETDHLERYITSKKSEEPPAVDRDLTRFTDPSDELDSAAYSWGEGVPVFHFPNNARSGRLGRSELAGVLNLQDQLNQSLANLLVTGEFQAYPQRWALGIEPDIDEETGEEIAFKPGPHRLWQVGSELAKFGQFEAASLEGFLKQQDAYDGYISRVTRVPVHWLGMTRDFPSGEALKTAESPFTVKIVDRSRSFGNSWEDVAAFALRIEPGAGSFAGVQFSTIWRSPEPRTDTDFWTVAQLKIGAGVPEDQVWREAGYSEAQIEEWLDAKQESASRALAAFNAGQMAGVPQPDGDDADNLDDQPQGDGEE